MIHNGTKTAKAGTAVVLAPQVMLLDVNHITEGRITMMQRKVHGMKLTIFTCYYPTEEYSNFSKKSF